MKTTDFIPYGHQCIDEDDIRSVTDALKSDFITQGPCILEFEKKICAITGSKYCVAVSNGTAALHIAVAALELPKKKIGITTPITFAASSNCILYNGLTVEFCDIDPKNYNINLEKIENKINENTALIIAVHYAGHAAGIEKLHQIAQKENIKLIEDASHAIGSCYYDNSSVGNCRYSDMTTFSFHPVKTITAGEGGAVTTNSEELYKKLLILRNHGITKEKSNFTQTSDSPWYYEMQDLGFNYRMSDIHAALGISQLDKLEQFKRRRMEIVQKYNDFFEKYDFLKVPYENSDHSSCFHLYPLLIDFEKLKKNRKDVMNELLSLKIGTQVHYIPIYRFPYYQQFGYKKADFPVAEKFYEQELSIPLFPALSNENIEYIKKSLISVLTNG